MTACGSLRGMVGRRPFGTGKQQSVWVNQRHKVIIKPRGSVTVGWRHHLGTPGDVILECPGGFIRDSEFAPKLSIRPRLAVVWDIARRTASAVKTTVRADRNPTDMTTDATGLRIRHRASRGSAKPACRRRRLSDIMAASWFSRLVRGDSGGERRSRVPGGSEAGLTIRLSLAARLWIAAISCCESLKSNTSKLAGIRDGLIVRDKATIPYC
jgi:hypothetical protein